MTATRPRAATSKGLEIVRRPTPNGSGRAEGPAIKGDYQVKKTIGLMAVSMLALAGAAPAAFAQDKEITFINCGDELTAG